MKNLFYAFIVFSFFSCGEKVKTLYIEDDTVVLKGSFNKKNQLNGIVRYYQRDNNILLSEYNYKNNKLEGEGIQYYKNGKVKSIVFYNNNLSDGFGYFYNPSGNLKGIKYYYNGLSVAHSTEYQNGQIDNYKFFNFEGKVIFRIYYDSIIYKKILDLEPNLFCFNFGDAIEYGDDDQLPEQELCFLYLPSPPKFRFDYSLIYTGNGYEKVELIDSLKSNNPWVEFKVPVDKDAEHRAAIMLEVFDSTKNIWLKAFKFLNDSSQIK